jgi:ankyrin repeat protein
VGTPSGTPRPDADAANRVREAIRQRDLVAFRAALPADPKRRAELLERSSALMEAVRADAPAILRQILAWTPGAIAHDAGRNGYLVFLASDWASRDDAAERAADDPSSVNHDDDDAPQAFRMLLDAGADPSDGRALAEIARIRPSPQVLESARLLLARGARIEALHPDQPSPFAEAASRDNIDLVCLMLASATPSQAALDAALGGTSLVDANPIAWYLVAKGADVNTPFAYGPRAPRQPFTPAWMLAGHVRRGERDLLRLFIEHRVDPDRPGPDNATALDLVAGDGEFVPALLALGADPNHHTRDVDPPLVQALRAGGKDEPGMPTDGRCHDLQIQGDPELRRAAVAALLQHGADPNLPANDGRTPLMETTRLDEDNIARLLAHGAVLEVPPRFRRNGTEVTGPIAWSVANGRESLALALLHRGATLDEDGRVLFMRAAECNSPRVLAELVARGVDPYGLRDLRADPTPLVSAARHGAVDSVRFLLDHHIGRIDEHTPRHWDLASYGSVTPLIAAVQGKSFETVRLLVERGARVSEKDAKDRTALDYASASRYGDPEIEAFLRAHGAH